MLKTLRRNTKIIIWAVVLSFCLWGGFAFSVQFQKEGRLAGEIFGRSISYHDFNPFYKGAQIFSYSGEAPKDPDMIHQQAWMHLILAREADHLKIKATDDEVRKEVLRILSSQKIEKPSQDFYERWVQNALRMTVAEFESQIREFLKIQKMFKQLMDEPIPSPPDDALRSRFDREENSLSLILIQFPNEKEAQEFHDKVRSNPKKQWDQEIQKNNFKTQSTGMIALDAVVNLWQIPEDISLELIKLDTGSVSRPFKRLEGYSVVWIADKKLADEAKWNDETKKQYRERLEKQARYEKMFAWQADVQRRADLKDFIPRPPAPPKAEPAPAAELSKTAESPASADQSAASPAETSSSERKPS